MGGGVGDGGTKYLLHGNDTTHIFRNKFSHNVVQIDKLRCNKNDQCDLHQCVFGTIFDLRSSHAFTLFSKERKEF